jgi:hypothetical protein
MTSVITSIFWKDRTGMIATDNVYMLFITSQWQAGPLLVICVIILP